MTRLLPIILAACSVASDPAIDAQRRPEQVISALSIADGAQIADIGAGRGYFTGKLADAAGPRGHVVATDIDADALAAIPHHPRVEVRRVAPDDPGLEAGAYDLLFLARVDQYLPDRVRYFRALRPALRPGGRLAVLNKLSYRRAASDAAAAAGFRVTGGTDALPGQYLLIFEVAP